NYSSGNQFGVTNLFIAQTGNAFSEKDDYHLTANSPARNAGFDGKDCGIYGGANPYKIGAVPMNPHIRSKEISAQTDGQGMLQIKATVVAQEN
ncbi:MAG TPA: hypothetical protein VK907_08965, partial [Phnomibacter sp.]|nr:hypothetical protein [Phnomibacter sp.]